MLQLFRKFILALALIAPGEVGCDKAIYKATECWVTFSAPAYVEYLTPDNIRRVLVVTEIKRAEGKK